MQWFGRLLCSPTAGFREREATADGGHKTTAPSGEHILQEPPPAGRASPVEQEGAGSPGSARFLHGPLYYQSGWCPGEAWGLGGSSAAQARVGKGPRCTPYAVPVPASSARSDRPIPHRSPGIKHPLTNAGPSLKRTRTPSCTNHSDDRARAHWPTAPTGRWESTVETTDAGWADHPMISTEQCPRLSIERPCTGSTRTNGCPGTRGHGAFRFQHQFARCLRRVHRERRPQDRHARRANGHTHLLSTT